MDIRKVQITGGSSFMVTLPKEWAESINLKKNDPVGLEIQTDGSLLIIAGGQQSEKTSSVKTIQAHDDTTLLYRQLIGAYIAGHKDIIVCSDDRLSGAVTETVSRFTQTSIGLEIVEEDDGHIVMRDLMNHTEINPLKSLERMRVLVNNMLSDIYLNTAPGREKRLANMNQRDTEVDRIHWLISRQTSIYLKDPILCKTMNVEPYQVSLCLTFSRLMERLGDHAVIISKNLLKLDAENKNSEVNKSIDEIGKDLTALLSDSMESWFTKDLMIAEECIEKGSAIVEHIKRSFRKIENDPDTASPTNLIAGSSRRVAEYCMDISEQTINSAMN